MIEFVLASLLFLIPQQNDGSISGRTTYADGSPYTDFVMAEPVSGQQVSRATVGEQGEGTFRISHLTPGRYYIRAGDAYFPGVTSKSGATVITVTEGSEIADIRFTIPPSMAGFRVSGSVIIPPGQPVDFRGISVMLSTSDRSGFILGRTVDGAFIFERRLSAAGTPEDTAPLNLSLMRPTVSVRVAADGSFEFPHVISGPYSIEADPAPGMRPVTLNVDRDTNIELRLPRLVEIDGSFVVDEGGRLPAFLNAGQDPAAVSFMGQDDANEVVGLDGTFKVFVPEGEYEIRFNGLPAGFYLKSLMNENVDLRTRNFKAVLSDKPSPIVATIRESKGVQFAGRIFGLPANDDADNVGQVLLSGLVSSTKVSTSTESDGSFSFPTIMPGAYLARVSFPGALASPPISVEVPDQNTKDFEIALPPPREIHGRITVDGGGPTPRFALYAGRVSDAESTQVMSAQNEQGGRTSAQILRIDVSALPDGTFSFKIPQGSYRAGAVPGSIATPYVMQSLSFGGTDLQTHPMKIGDRSDELQVSFRVAQENPWARISGHVLGMSPSTGPFRIRLESGSLAPLESFVNTDGTFEFPRVLKSTTYSSILVPEDKSASPSRIVVGDKDVRDLEIRIPHQRDISGHVVVENHGPVPSFVLELTGDGSIASVAVRPDASGSFRIQLPEDERELRVEDSLPLGYRLKSVSYGGSIYAPCKVNCPKLKLDSLPNSELQVEFSVDPSIPFVKFGGRILGLPADSAGTRIVLQDALTLTSFEGNMSGSDAFEFQALPQGVYVPLLISEGKSALLDPSVLSLSSDQRNTELKYTKGNTKRSADIETNSGARITEADGQAAMAGGESFAVAALRTLTTAEVTYLAASAGNFGSLQQMIEAGLAPAELKEPINGFRLSVISVGSDFAAAAIPASAGSGRYGFYVTADGTVRYSAVEALAPPGKSRSPVN